MLRISQNFHSVNKRFFFKSILFLQTKEAEQEEEDSDEDILEEEPIINNKSLERQLSILSSGSYNSDTSLPRHVGRTLSAASRRLRSATRNKVCKV